MVSGGDGAAAGGGDREALPDGGMSGHETLQSAGGAEALHRSFSFPERQVAVFGPVVEAFVSAMLQAWHNLVSGRDT